MKLSLGFSTCPNDTFIFEAIVHSRVDTEGLEFSPNLADIEDLNMKAFEAGPDISKLSYNAYGHLTDRYLVLDAGSALGEGNGPLLLSKTKIYPDEVPSLRIAIPGKYTTANLLLDIAFPKVKEKRSYLFSDIEEVILSGEMDAGLAIHENRFTYQKRGLRKILDLGTRWEELSGRPIPLGGIMVKRSLGADVIGKVNRILRRSVEFAFAHPEMAMSFVQQHAQEMDRDVMRKHIGLYVNDYTLSLGDEGRAAIRKLYEIAAEKGVLPQVRKDIFVVEGGKG